MTTRPTVLVVILVAIAVSAAYGGTPVNKPQEVFAPYWTSEPGWDTELQLKNNLNSVPLTVTPVLRLASGEEIALDPVTIPSSASVSLFVNEGLLKHSPDLVGQPGSYGSVVFRFTSLNAMNLHASVVLSIHGEPISFPTGALPSVDVLHANGSGSLEGIWWQPRQGINDVLVMSNRSNNKVSGTLSLFDASGTRWSEPLSLAAHQTLRMSAGDLVRKAGLSGSYGGIKFDVPAAVSAVDAVHFMYDEASKFSSSLEIFTRDPNATVFVRTGTDAKQFTMRAPMLALSNPDPALNLPGQTLLQPFILVRNTTAKLISADLALNWRSNSTKGQAKLPELQLPPFATQQVQIGTVQKQLGIPDDAHWALVTLTTAAAPDDLIAITSSRDASGRYGVETSFSGGFGKHLEGGELNSDANHNQIISVTNSGQKTTEALLTLHYDNGKKKYELQQTIQPGNQMWANVSELIGNRVPDRNGHTLPGVLTPGTYDVRELSTGHSSRGNLTERSLALDQTLGARVIPQATTKCSCVDEGAHWDPNNFLFLLESGGDATDYANIMATDSCGGVIENVSDDFTTWTSSDPAVATVATKKVTGVSAGTATATAEGYMLVQDGTGTCDYVADYVEAPVTVANLSCTSSVTRGATATCTVTPSSGVSVSGWQFQDSSGSTVKRTSSTGSLTWSGTMVAGGTVSVTATPSSGPPAPLSASITVNNRTNFAFTAVSPTQVGGNTITCYSGSTITLPSPPVDTASTMGAACADLAYSVETSASLSDNGPNDGYQYVTSVSSTNGSQSTQFQFIVVSDLLGATAFYTAQCGNYSSSNSAGFIAGSQLSQNAVDHEGGSVLSHWTEYSAAQNDSSNNVGTILEAMVAGPSTSQATYEGNLTTAANSAMSNIQSAVAGEPCGGELNEDSSQSCKYCGNINYSPYQSCGSSQPVPYCH